MGFVLSAVLLGGLGGDEAAGTESNSSSLLKFSYATRWQLHFKKIKDTSKLLVVDFSTSWCGPCKMIEPAIHAMANKYTDVGFVKLDVDELHEPGRIFSFSRLCCALRGIDIRAYMFLLVIVPYIGTF